MVRIHDISESLRDLISGTLETYLSVVSNRTNDIMKTLTIVTVMFMPMTFLVGFFGMNFFGETLAFTTPVAQGLALLGSERDHGDIALLHLDLRAAAEVVLKFGPRSGRPSQDIAVDERSLAAQAPRPGPHPEPEPRGRDLAPGRAAPAQSRHRRPGQGAGRFSRPGWEACTTPSCYPGAVEAAERIVRAIRDDRKIVIYGDYDVDGVCGTSIFWACLRLAGAAHVEYYIPHRVEEGYGVNAEALRRLAVGEQGRADRHGRLRHLGGARGRAGARAGRRADHHRPPHDRPGVARGRRDRPPALARRPSPAPISAAPAVAFKLAWQVCKSFGDGKRASPHLREFLVGSLGLVALATIADMVPLSDENRVMVRHGLAGIAAEPSAGLRALMEVSGSLDKKRLTTGMVGFGLAPRINAAGRLEQAMMAVEMLTTDDPPSRATRSRCRSTAATSAARKSNARSSTKPRRCSRPRGAWATGGRSCWDARAGTRASSASSPAAWPRRIIGRP